MSAIEVVRVAVEQRRVFLLDEGRCKQFDASPPCDLRDALADEAWNCFNNYPHQ